MQPALRLDSVEEKKRDVPLSIAIQAAKRLYTLEMGKVTNSNDNQTEKKLRENHDRIADLTVQQLKSKLPLTPSEENNLFTEFNDLLQSILDRTLHNDEQSPAIGIDLGTTYSCVGVYKDGKVTIIPNELGQKTTPSYVALDDEEVLQIGDPAKTYIHLSPTDIIFNVKRLIGRSFDDPIVQQDMAMWPFQVVSQGNTPVIRLKGRSYFPEQISAKILISLKEQAETHLNCPVTNAVITVPAYFNDGQREATKDAGTIAGLNVLRIINEPTAAALAYSHKLGLGQDEKKILVFDLGGGTFDVSICSLSEGHIRILGVGGDTHLGGEDFDNRMMDYCINELKTKSKVDLTALKQSKNEEIWGKSNRALRRLKNSCEEAKINLSVAPSSPIALDNLFDRTDFRLSFRRDLFNSLNRDIFEKCLTIMDNVLEDVGLDKTDIQEVVMIGGSTRILKIKEMVQDYFGGKELCRSIHPDEAVAHGAALQAALMSTLKKDGGNNETNGWSPEISDVIPLNLGIKIYLTPDQGKKGGLVEDFSVVIPKNTSVPCSNTKQYSTPYANCTELEISVFEGTEKSTEQNHLLGKFIVGNLPPNCPEGEIVNVNMEINSEGILHVSAGCPSAPNSQNQITVSEFKERLKYEDVLSLIMEELFLGSAE